jgi:hypothetical protein
MQVNLDGRTFLGAVNYDDGDLNQETRFTYHQRGNAVWGEVTGGQVVAGSLVAAVRDDGALDMCWMYINFRAEVVAGVGVSVPDVLPDGRIRLSETWEVTKGPNAGLKGTSVIAEILEA